MSGFAEPRIAFEENGGSVDCDRPSARRVARSTTPPSGSPLGLRSLCGSSRVRECSPRRDSGVATVARRATLRTCSPTLIGANSVRSGRRRIWPTRARPRSPLSPVAAYSARVRPERRRLNWKLWDSAPGSAFSTGRSRHPLGAKQRDRRVQPIRDLATMRRRVPHRARSPARSAPRCGWK